MTCGNSAIRCRSNTAQGDRYDEHYRCSRRYFPLLDGYDGTVFRVLDGGAVVTGDDSDDLLNVYRSAPPLPGSSHVHDDEHVNMKLGAGWTVVAHLYTESTRMHYRHQKVLDAARSAMNAPGVYAVETVLDGDEYAELSAYLLRFEGK